MVTPQIFLNYRREDSAPYALHLHENLCQRFGNSNVFIDVVSIQPGSDFTEVLDDVLAHCQVILIVIGPNWLTPNNESGTRRLDEPQDYVRIEIERALDGATPVIIPVLVGGATVPIPEMLPVSIRSISQRQAFTLSNQRWAEDLDHLDRLIRVGGRQIASRPTGTVTLLSSQIEGRLQCSDSTEELDFDLPTEPEALNRIESLNRQAIEDNGGYLFSYEPTEFNAAFSELIPAVRTAVTVQRTIIEEFGQNRVALIRMAIDIGTCQERDGIYLGPAVNRVSQLARAAHDGQILLTSRAATFIVESPSEDLRLKDLGEHRLRDLGHPEHVFQLVTPGLPQDFPSLLSLSNPALKHNLARQLSTFIGRHEELTRVRDLVDRNRLVSIVGAGGSGKTRLALQAAADLLDGSGEGVWFVDLCPVSDPNLVADAVAHSIGIHLQQSHDATEMLVDALEDRHALLILDNCEHLVSACAHLADTVLQRCSSIHILTTSREPLGVSGESVFRIPPLRLPSQEAVAAESEAVRLFVERASEYGTDFELTDETANIIASICERLDGMPLAIELAAARVSSMDLTHIRDRLENSLGLLTSTNSTVTPRQKTVRALIKWSYDLLTDTERLVVQQLSIFAGGWDLVAAEGICGTVSSDADLQDILRALIDKSIVNAEPRHSGMRYSLLETIRQFAIEMLTERGAREVDRVRQAHFEYFFALAERARSELQGADQARCLNRLEDDHENISAAVKWIGDKPEGCEPALLLMLRLVRFFKARHLNEGVQVLTSLVDMEESEQYPSLKAEALGALGNLVEGKNQARELIQRGLTIAKSLADKRLMSELLTHLSWTEILQLDFSKSVALSQEAAALAQGLGDDDLLGRALQRQANAMEALDSDKAMSLYEDALHLFRRVGDRHYEAVTLINLAAFLQDRDLNRAALTYSAALEIMEELKDNIRVSRILMCLGEVALCKNDFQIARDYYWRSLDLARSLGSRVNVAYSTLGLAELYSRSATSHDSAALLLGSADGQIAALDQPWQAGSVQLRQECLDTLRREMGESFEDQYQRGRIATIDETIAIALGEREHSL